MSRDEMVEAAAQLTSMSREELEAAVAVLMEDELRAEES
jgi:hypothetical protein